MACADASVAERLLDGARQLEQAQGVGDGGAALADALTDLGLGKRKFVDEGLEGGGFFERVEVGALEVFDQRQLDQLLRRRLADDGRHDIQCGQPCRAPTPFSGDEPVLVRLLRSAW